MATFMFGIGMFFFNKLHYLWQPRLPSFPSYLDQHLEDHVLQNSLARHHSVTDISVDMVVQLTLSFLHGLRQLNIIILLEISEF